MSYLGEFVMDVKMLRKEFTNFGKSAEMSSSKDSWKRMSSEFLKWRNREEKKRQKEEAKKAKELANANM